MDKEKLADMPHRTLFHQCDFKSWLDDGICIKIIDEISRTLKFCSPGEVETLFSGLGNVT